MIAHLISIYSSFIIPSLAKTEKLFIIGGEVIANILVTGATPNILHDCLIVCTGLLIL